MRDPLAGTTEAGCRLEPRGAEPHPPIAIGRPRASEAAPGLRRGGADSFSGAKTFHGDASQGEVRPPNRTGLPLTAACVPRATPGPGGPREKTAQHLGRRDPHGQLGGRDREFANSALEFGGGDSSRKNLPLLPPPATSPTLFCHQPGTPSSHKALWPCRTQMFPGALMPPQCGPPVLGVPEPLQRAPVPQPQPSPESRGP